MLNTIILIISLMLINGKNPKADGNKIVKFSVIKHEYWNYSNDFRSYAHELPFSSIDSTNSIDTNEYQESLFNLIFHNRFGLQADRVVMMTDSIDGLKYIKGFYVSFPISKSQYQFETEIYYGSVRNEKYEDLPLLNSTCEQLYSSYPKLFILILSMSYEVKYHIQIQKIIDIENAKLSKS